MKYANEFPELWERARRSLESCLVAVDDPNLPVRPKRLAAAGGHQFRSFWTRDFAFAARGLCAAGFATVASEQARTLLGFARPVDGLIPRLLDCGHSRWRILRHTIGLPVFDLFERVAPILERGEHPKNCVRRITPEYLGEHGTPAIDSNGLVIEALCATGAQRSQLSPELNGCLDRTYGFLLEATGGGSCLLKQGPYEDWQDSSRREGATFYANLVAARAFQLAADIGVLLPPACDRFRDLFWQSFPIHENGSLPPSILGRSERSIDGLLLALKWSLVPPQHRATLYASLRQHSLWTSGPIPGHVTEPDWPISEISWTTRFAGLRHYHDRLVWPWLSGLSALIAARIGDPREARRILAWLDEVTAPLDAIPEVFESDARTLVRRPIYRSEMPFAWAAGMICEALNEPIV